MQKQQVVVRVALTCIRVNALYVHRLSVAKVQSAFDATAPLFLKSRATFVETSGLRPNRVAQ